MQAMRDFFKKCPLVVSSCDAYSDIWGIFFTQLFKYWPEIEGHVYLLSNHKKYNDPRVHSICTGKDLDWGSNMLVALPQIPADYLIYFQDDYLLDRKVDVNYLSTWIERYINTRGKYFSLKNIKINPSNFGGGELKPISKESFDSWFADFNAGVWKSDMLLQLAQLKLNVWQTESEIRKLRFTDIDGFYYISENEKPLLNYVQGVKGKFWLPDAIDFCKKEGLQPDLKHRPCPPQGQDLISKLIRSYHKRRMQLVHCINSKREEKIIESN